MTDPNNDIKRAKDFQGPPQVTGMRAYRYQQTYTSFWDEVLLENKSTCSSSSSKEMDVVADASSLSTKQRKDSLDGSEHKEEEIMSRSPVAKSVSEKPSQIKAILRAQALLEAHAMLKHKEASNPDTPLGKGPCQDVNLSNVTAETETTDAEEESESLDVPEDEKLDALLASEEPTGSSPEDGILSPQGSACKNNIVVPVKWKDPPARFAKPSAEESTPERNKNNDVMEVHSSVSDATEDKAGICGTKKIEPKVDEFQDYHNSLENAEETPPAQAADLGDRPEDKVSFPKPEEQPRLVDEATSLDQENVNSMEKAPNDELSKLEELNSQTTFEDDIQAANNAQDETTDSDLAVNGRKVRGQAVASSDEGPFSTSIDFKPDTYTAEVDGYEGDSDMDFIVDETVAEDNSKISPEAIDTTGRQTGASIIDAAEENDEYKIADSKWEEPAEPAKRATEQIVSPNAALSSPTNDSTQQRPSSLTSMPYDKTLMLAKLNKSPEGTSSKLVADLVAQVVAKAAKQELENRRKREAKTPREGADLANDHFSEFYDNLAGKEDPEELARAQAKILSQAEALAKAQAYLQAQAKALEQARQQVEARRSASSSAIQSPVSQEYSSTLDLGILAPPSPMSASASSRPSPFQTPQQRSPKAPSDLQAPAASPFTPLRSNTGRNFPQSPKAVELKQRVRRHTEWLQKAKADAEAKAREFVEIAQKEAAARKQARMEARAKAEKEAKARAKAEAEAKMRAKAQVDESAFAETQAKVQAQMQAEQEAKARAKMEVEEKLQRKALADAQVLALAEEEAKAEAKIRTKAEQSFKEDLSKNLSAAQRNARATKDSDSQQGLGSVRSDTPCRHGTKALMEAPPKFIPFGKSKADEEDNFIALYLQVPGVVHVSELKVELEDGVLYITRGIMAKGTEGVQKFTRSFPFEEQILDTSRIVAKLIPAGQTVDGASVLKFTLPKMPTSLQIPLQVVDRAINTTQVEEEKKQEEEDSQEALALDTFGGDASVVRFPTDEVASTLFSPMEVPHDEKTAHSPVATPRAPTSNNNLGTFEEQNEAEIEDATANDIATDISSDGYRILKVYVPKNLSAKNVSLIYRDNTIRITGREDDGHVSFHPSLPIDSEQTDVRKLESTFDPFQRLLVIRAPLREAKEGQAKMEARRIRVTRMEDAEGCVISLFGDDCSLSTAGSEQQQRRARKLKILSKLPGVKTCKAATKFIQCRKKKQNQQTQILW